MAYWLLKTEPARYSWEDLARDRRTVWDGVSNAWALRKVRAMHKGDQAIICHGEADSVAVGVAQVVSEPYRRPNVPDARLWVVDVKPMRRFRHPINLNDLITSRAFARWELWGMQRLAVVAVPPKIWQKLEQLGKGG